MALTEQEKQIVEFGGKSGKSSDEIINALQKYRQQQQKFNLDANNAPLQQTSEFVTGLKDDLNTRVDRVGEILNRTDSSVPEKAVQVFGQGAGLAANAIEKTAEQIPGVKQVAGAIGAGINWLATSDISPIKHLGDIIGDSKKLQEIVQIYDTDANFRDSVDSVANIVRLGGDVQGVVDSAVFTKNVTSKVVNKLNDATTKIAGAGDNLINNIQPIVDPIKEVISNTTNPDKIMQRVARISKGKQAAFEKTAGESVGQYLTNRGIYGDIDAISEQLYKRFEQSKSTADDALAQLKGTFEPAPIKTALTELADRESRVSSPGAPSKSFSRIKELQSKFEKQGLTMSEINEVKRLFEANNKLDYLRQNLPEKVAYANNIDNAIREWQFKQAETLGLKNLPEINKETRLAKQLLNDLGQEYAGSAGNNSITLTDWILLSGGDPTAVGAFLTKKILSSKNLQSTIAKKLNRNKPIKEQVKADLGTSQIKQLPAPKEGAPKSSINTPKLQPSRRKIAEGTEIVPNSTKQQLQSQPIEAKSPYKETITQTSTKSNSLLEGLSKKQKEAFKNGTPKEQKEALEYLKLKKGMENSPEKYGLKVNSKIPSQLELLKEAKKYKSAEEFVSNLQGSATQYGDYTPNIRHFGMEDYKNISELGVNPEKMVAIYRGIDDINGKMPRKINDGDFVTTDFDSAMSYAGKNNVVSMKVPAKTLYTDAIDDFKSEPFYTGSEYVYTTQKVNPLTKSQLTDIWSKANKK